MLGSSATRCSQDTLCDTFRVYLHILYMVALIIKHIPFIHSPFQVSFRCSEYRVLHHRNNKSVFHPRNHRNNNVVQSDTGKLYHGRVDHNLHNHFHTLSWFVPSNIFSIPEDESLSEQAKVDGILIFTASFNHCFSPFLYPNPHCKNYFPRCLCRFYSTNLLPS